MQGREEREREKKGRDRERKEKERGENTIRKKREHKCNLFGANVLRIAVDYRDVLRKCRKIDCIIYNYYYTIIFILYNYIINCS